jgi:succinyl-CoA synthetase beta subunit
MPIRVGLPVKAVLIHEGVDINKQIYLGFLMDRKHGGPVILASKNGIGRGFKGRRWNGYRGGS